MIPNIIHFVWPKKDFQGSPFHLTHRIAIESAIALNTPESVFVHCQEGQEPDGPEWEKIRSKVTLAKRHFHTRLENGRWIRCPAHQSDVVRLEVLIEQGGVYLDFDTICVKPFGELMSNAVVIGRESERALPNAILLAEPGAEFVKLWRQAYTSYSGSRWGYHGARVPAILNDLFPSLATVLPKSAFYSVTSADLNEIFVHDFSHDEALVYHLYGSHSWHSHLKRLNAAEMREQDTTYNRLARPYLGD